MISNLHRYLPASRNKVLEDSVGIILPGRGSHLPEVVSSITRKDILRFIGVVHVNEWNVDSEFVASGFDVSNAGSTGCVEDSIICCILPCDVEEEDYDTVSRLK
jgi:hypothetical protein